MKLSNKPGASSMASSVVLAEIGDDLAVEVVETTAGETGRGARFREINPKGKVPALKVDGEVLTEGPATSGKLDWLEGRLAARPSAHQELKAKRLAA